MTKLMLHSNAPWAPTGYGQQTGTFAPMLADHYDLAISSFYGLEGSPITWSGIQVLPGVAGAYGEKYLVDHCQHLWGDPRAGIVMTLMDVWVLSHQVMRQLNACAWVPVDHEPAPPQVTNYFIQTDAVPIAMSRFGERMLGRLDPLYVPHGIDTSVYRPLGRAAARKAGGLPEDAFVVGMVAANKGRPSRKGFSQAFQAFRRLLDKRPNAILYLHTVLDGGFSQGEDIPALLAALGIPDENIRKADQYAMGFAPYPPKAMATLYSAMDVLLCPSLGEGFGIPVVEAQACGTPVIVHDFSAQSELCGAGWKVRTAQRWWTGLDSWQAIPDVDDIAAALLEAAFLPRGQRDLLGKQARTFSLQYDARRVFQEHMLPALRVVEQRFANRRPFTIAPRAGVAA